MKYSLPEKKRIPWVQTIIWHIAFIVTVAFLIWKCQYGYAFSDEAFYLSIPYRMSMGDTLLLQEWHPSQLTAFLMYPLVKTYLLLAGNTEGIFLHFRVLYTLIWSAAAYFFYLRLRRFSLSGSMLGSLIFLVYTPFGIMALSYNSLGILLMIGAGLMIASNDSRNRWMDAVGGILFAGAVLCCPYLILIYFSGTMIWFFRSNRKKEQFPRNWIYFSAGCVFLLIIILIYLFSHGTWQEYLQVFPRILEDPEHSTQGLWQKVVSYWKSLLIANTAVIPCLIGTAICWLFLRKRRADISFALVCCLSGVVFLFFRGTYYNNVMLAINLAGLYCGLSGKGEKLKRLFHWVFIPGAAYTFCIYLSSNQRLYAITSASTVMTIVTPALLMLYLQELGNHQRLSINSRRIEAGLCALLIAAQLTWEYRLRYNMVFGESGMTLLNTRIEEGAEKGLWTTIDQADKAKWMEADATVIKADSEARSLLVLDPDNLPMYFSAGKEISAYSAWLSGLSDTTLQRLEKYESLHPEKQPDLVYLPAWNSDWANYYLYRGYVKQILPSGAWLLRKQE